MGLEVWLELSVLASRLRTSANCLLILSLQQSLDHERVKDVGLLAVVVLVIGLVEASSQLELLFTEVILGPETNKTVWPGWIVLEGDFRDE